MLELSLQMLFLTKIHALHQILQVVKIDVCTIAWNAHTVKIWYSWLTEGLLGNASSK